MDGRPDSALTAAMREPAETEMVGAPSSARTRERPRQRTDNDPEPSLRDLTTRLIDDGRSLVRQEIDLAKSETFETVRVYSVAGATVAGGVLLALVGVLVLLAFLVITLGTLLDGRYWLSSLIAAVLFMLAGGLIVRRGRARLAANTPRPERTIDTLRETAAWAVRQTDRPERSATGRNRR